MNAKEVCGLKNVNSKECKPKAKRPFWRPFKECYLFFAKEIITSYISWESII